MLLIRPDRVAGLVYRYFLVLSRSSFRVLDIVFWPVMDLIVWGFVSNYFNSIGKNTPSAVTFLIGAIIFFNVLHRAQQSISVSFLEDMWSRNLLSIFIAPITVGEFVSATYTLGILQAVAVMTITSIMAALLYSFDMFSLSWYLIPLFVNLLVMGWWLGLLTTACILRFGYQAEALAWAIPFLLQPISAVFYPLSILPQWLQPVALMVPATHVFEGLRYIISGGTNAAHYLWTAAALNLVYWTLTTIFFGAQIQRARVKGSLAKLVT
ncbi:MAG: ABC transporter permease [Candidatus Obscuribacter sp.]|nr:ABC transporter permease [Candidatus Obscuribacter sp.]MBK9621654.1 ABC transporter permease [Candidatus Obscuribacter sp.]